MGDEGFIQCPVCSSALEPVVMQQGVYDCPNCGEVEEEEDGFIVNGSFYKTDTVDRDGLGELDADDTDNDFGDPEDEGIISKALAGLDVDIDELDDFDDDDDFGDLADMGDIGFTLEETGGDSDMEEKTA